MPELDWKMKANKQLSKIPAPYREQIRETANELGKWPEIQHLKVEKLTDDKEERRKLVVGNYRVIWKIVKGKPVVIEILEVLRRTSTTYSKR
ncbi:type II toxin-antitoxin system RelE/ParE family toxin [Erwiniaceae bacterium L1_54_6]|jgi:mRNA interferase RelE/StbE|nr:type II toxin-antitoxin system RelE/ParE family toxin [Erwiniaceae bacterium L1_54_6]